MTNKIVLRRPDTLTVNESLVSLPPGDGNVDNAAREILRLCRRLEASLPPGSVDVPVVQLETETDLRAAETLQDHSLGSVMSKPTGWFFIATSSKMEKL